MKVLRALGFAAVLALAGIDAASAGPMPVDSITVPATSAALGAEKVVLVCGPFRCVRRFGWRYGYGYRPFVRFGYRPYYGGYGFRRYGWRRY